MLTKEELPDCPVGNHVAAHRKQMEDADPAQPAYPALAF